MAGQALQEMKTGLDPGKSRPVQGIPRHSQAEAHLDFRDSVNRSAGNSPGAPALTLIKIRLQTPESWWIPQARQASTLGTMCLSRCLGKQQQSTRQGAGGTPTDYDTNPPTSATTTDIYKLCMFQTTLAIILSSLNLMYRVY